MKKRNLIIENKIVEEYLNGINNKELCEKYKKSRSYIQTVLIRHNIKLRNGSDVTKKYNINEKYFEKIDNEDKAYILGLIYSDGTITDRILKINITETDSHILYDIAKKIYNDNIYQIYNIDGMWKKWNDGNEYYSKPQKVLNITRKKIVNDLKTHGLDNKKTFKIKKPNIESRLMKDFIRGYFDGDGNFYVSDKYKNNNRINIVSNSKFCLDLKNIIESNLNIRCIITHTKIENIHRLNIYGNKKVKIFLDWIYYNSELKLNRKYIKYIKEYENKSNL